MPKLLAIGEHVNSEPSSRANHPSATNSESLVQIRRDALLTPDTEVKGQYEKALKDILLDLRIPAYYEAAELVISGNYIYKPDFITGIFIDGKRVVFEPHHDCHGQYMRRMKELRETYGDQFYFILISSKLKEPEQTWFEFQDPMWSGRASGSYMGSVGVHLEFVDEYWKLPKILLDGRGFDTKTYDLWKERVRGALNELVEGCAKVLRDESQVQELISA